jgi:drug/metabolite transporter (DMT)-like permease
MILTAVTGVVGVLVVEGFALFNETGGDTLSEIVADASDITGAMPFALGVLVGHFVSRREVRVSKTVRMIMGLSLIPGAVLAHILGGPVWAPAAVGLASGFVLWPLSK